MGWLHVSIYPPEVDTLYEVLRTTNLIIKCVVVFSSFESSSTILKIKDVQESDEGLYKCEVAVDNSPKLYLGVEVLPKGQQPSSSSAAGNNPGANVGGTASSLSPTSHASLSLFLFTGYYLALQHQLL